MIKNNFYLIFFGIFSLAATILGSFAYINYKRTQNLLAEGIKTTAIVEGSYIEKNGHIRYKLMYFDQQQRPHIYWLEKQVWTASFNYGDKVQIYYLPDRPEVSTSSGTDAWFMTILLSGFFVVFGTIGYVGLGKQLISFYEKQNLRERGVNITTRIDDVYKNSSVKVNNEYPYVIRSTYKSPLNNKIYIFYSENIWFNPLPYLKDSIIVKVNPNDYTEYIVETDFLK